MRVLLLAPLLFLLLNTMVRAEESVVATGIVSGDEVALQDGRVLRLAGIKAIPAAKAFLEETVKGRMLEPQNGSTDRYGRLVAVASVPHEGLSVEELLLREGLAFVYPATSVEIPEGWLAVERGARLGKKGLWATHADIPAAEADKLCRTYGFVVGPIAKVERIKNKVYVTFGGGGPKDFSLVIAAKYLRLFKKKGIDPLGLTDQKLRVRGWVNCAGAPTMTLTDVWQVEVE